VYDPKAPSSLRALEAYADRANARSVLRYAMWRTKSRHEAEDLIADAMERVLDPADLPWDPSVTTFRRHMRMVMNDDFIEQHRRGFGKYETVDSDHEAFDRVAQPTPAPDMALQARRRLGWLRGLMLRVLGRLKKQDELAPRVYELACDNRHEEPHEFAEALGVPVEEIIEAMHRLRYHGKIVRAEWEAEERQRMAGLREQAERARKKEER